MNSIDTTPGEIDGDLTDAGARESGRSELLIEAGRGGRQYWSDVWRYRELLLFLAWRDLLVRYKQTFVGVSWAVVRPLLTMMVLTFVFGKVAGFSSGDTPYPLLVLCGMLPWQFFATAFAESGNSLVTNAGMISKVYFPRLIVPASSLLPSFVDLLISVGLMGLVMVFYQFTPSPRIVLLPLFFLMALGLALGAGIWVSALMVRFRDFRFIVPFVVQFGLYLSPVGFTAERVPEAWRDWCAINPMFAIIEGFRWCILGEGFEISATRLCISAAIIGAIIITGVRYFRNTERTFADVI